MVVSWNGGHPKPLVSTPKWSTSFGWFGISSILGNFHTHTYIYIRRYIYIHVYIYTYTDIVYIYIHMYMYIDVCIHPKTFSGFKQPCWTNALCSRTRPAPQPVPAHGVSDGAVTEACCRRALGWSQQLISPFLVLQPMGLYTVPYIYTYCIYTGAKKVGEVIFYRPLYVYI